MTKSSPFYPANKDILRRPAREATQQPPQEPSCTRCSCPRDGRDGLPGAAGAAGEDMSLYTHTLEALHVGHLGTRKNCPDYESVPILGVKAVV
jgi:hypothetical protein